jgi:heat shock protein HslJ
MEYQYNMKYFFTLCALFISLSSSAQKTKTLYVADRTLFRAGVDCIQIKEKKKGDWNVCVDSINGLAYEEGYEYKIKATASKSGVAYTFVKLLSKKKTGYNPAVKLEGKQWRLLAIRDNGHTMDLKDTTYFLKFDISNGHVSGRIVCNSLRGTVKAEGRKIAFSGIGYTKMKCIDPNEQMERIVSYMLEHSTAYELKGDQLYLRAGEGSYVVLVAQ